jgi:hypothetical protein
VIWHEIKLPSWSFAFTVVRNFPIGGSPFEVDVPEVMTADPALRAHGDFEKSTVNDPSEPPSILIVCVPPHAGPVAGFTLIFVPMYDIWMSYVALATSFEITPARRRSGTSSGETIVPAVHGC